MIYYKFNKLKRPVKIQIVCVEHGAFFLDCEEIGIVAVGVSVEHCIHRMQAAIDLILIADYNALDDAYKIIKKNILSLLEFKFFNNG